MKSNSLFNIEPKKSPNAQKAALILWGSRSDNLSKIKEHYATTTVNVQDKPKPQKVHRVQSKLDNPPKSKTCNCGENANVSMNYSGEMRCNNCNKLW